MLQRHMSRPYSRRSLGGILICVPCAIEIGASAQDEGRLAAMSQLDHFEWALGIPPLEAKRDVPEFLANETSRDVPRCAWGRQVAFDFWTQRGKMTADARRRRQVAICVICFGARSWGVLAALSARQPCRGIFARFFDLRTTSYCCQGC